MNLAALIDEYLGFVFRSDPIQASRLGIHEHDHSLGQVDAETFADQAATRRQFLHHFQSVAPQSLNADERMDLQVAIIDLEMQLRLQEDVRAWERAPYWYLERLGDALSDLMGREIDTIEERGRRLHTRLEQTPRYLAAAQRNLTDQAPAIWVEMGLVSARGLQDFLAAAVPAFARAVSPALRSDLTQVTPAALAALVSFEQFLQDLHGKARGTYACGPGHLDFLLRHFHLLDMDHCSLYEFGLEQVEADTARLEALAKELDPSSTWVEQIHRIKDNHPQAAEFLDVYRREMIRARNHCIQQDLVTLPRGEQCRVDWLPAYLSAGAPLGLMYTSPPFEDDLESILLITQVDPDAPPERQREHRRDTCYAFAQSITLHEIYPGHHVQQLHHKLGTANSPMRRYFSSPLFVEGWGLYTEDLMEETGFLSDPAVKLFKLRNALWRSVRVVIDTSLHTRGMTVAEAVKLLREKVCLDGHMAEGEVRRYTTHDNPTYPSSYLAGKVLIKQLREQCRRRQGDNFHLKTFHNRLLSYGSPPVRLVSERMLEPDAGSKREASRA